MINKLALLKVMHDSINEGSTKCSDAIFRDKMLSALDYLIEKDEDILRELGL